MPSNLQYVVSFFFIILASFTVAQDEDPERIDLEYEVSLVTPSKLSSFTTIQNVIQDSLGFLWIGTNEGLHSLDGNDLVTYNLDPEIGKIGIGQKGDGYFRTAMGRDNILWATENTSNYVVGIDILKRKEVRRIKIEDFVGGSLQTLENGDTYLIYSDIEYTTWLLCVSCDKPEKKRLMKDKYAGNYRHFRNEHWLHLDSTFNRYAANGELMNTYPLNNLYMNWEYGDSLTFYDPDLTNPSIFRPDKGGIVKQFKVPGRFRTGGFHHFVRDKDLWLTNLHHSFFIWNSEENTVQDYSSIISSMLKEEAPSGLSGDFRFELELSDGSILYSRFNTLLRFTKKTLETGSFKENLVSEEEITSMRGLAEDQNGNIYASYYTAVAVKKSGQDTFQTYRDTKSGLKEAERTYSLSNWENKLIWDMAVFDLKDNSRSSFVKDLYGQHVNHYVEEDTLWAYEWYANTFIKYDLSTGEHDIISEDLIKKSPVVSDLEVESRTGLLWFATQYYGILVYSKAGQLIRSYDLKFLGLPKMKNNIYFIEHEGDSVWFGTELGLGLLNKKTQKVELFNNPISNKDGIEVGRKIYSVLKDDEDNFYLGTDFGICYFDKKEFRFQNLIPRHPLAKIEFNRNSTLKAKDGKFYFGSIDGLYSFFPDQLKFEDDLDVPEPYLASVIVFNKDESVPRIFSENLNVADEIRLKSHETDVSIIFGAPSYENEVFYRYRIPKIKDEWSNYSTNNQLEFVSFPPGRHEIQVRTYLRPESDNLKSFSVSIFKPLVWYKRAWVIVCLSLLGITLVSGLFWLRFQSVLKQKEYDEKLRTKISIDLHDEVGSLLSGVALQSEVLSYGMNDEAKSDMNEISDMSREAMERMRDIVWAIDSRKDKYENLIDRMRSYADKTLGNQQIDVTFQVSGFDKSGSIDPASRQNFYLIFKEAVTNIIKHSDADKVDITFSKRGKLITLTIEDNGSVKSQVKSDGLGLENIKMRAEQLGGEVKFENDEGFKVELSI